MPRRHWLVLIVVAFASALLGGLVLHWSAPRQQVTQVEWNVLDRGDTMLIWSSHPPRPGRAAAAMEAELPVAELGPVSLNELAAWVTYHTGCDVLVSRAHLEFEGVDPDLPFTLNLRHPMRTRDLLRHAVDVAGDGFAELIVVADGDVILLTDPGARHQDVTVRMYPVADLVRDVYRLEVRRYLLSPLPVYAGESAGEVTGGGGIAPPSPLEYRHLRYVPGRPPYLGETTGWIMESITENIAPDTWRMNGGWIGSILELGGILVIRTTPELHEEVQAHLLEVHNAIRQQLHELEPPDDVDEEAFIRELRKLFMQDPTGRGGG